MREQWSRLETSDGSLRPSSHIHNGDRRYHDESREELARPPTVPRGQLVVGGPTSFSSRCNNLEIRHLSSYAGMFYS